MSFYVNTLKFIDRFFVNLFCIVFGFFVYVFNKIFGTRFPDKCKENKVRNILFIKLWAIGDTVNFLPLIDSLKKQYPKAKLWALARDRNVIIFEASGLIDKNKILLFEPRAIVSLLKHFRRFDIVIDGEPYLGMSALLALFFGRFRLGFANQIRSLLYHKKIPYSRKKHIVKTYLDFANVFGANTNYDILMPLENIPKSAVFSVNKKLNEKNISPKKDILIGFFMGAAESAAVSRSWPLERFAELACKLSSFNQRIKIILPVPESEKKTINRFMKLLHSKDRVFPVYGNLFESIYLISLMNVFVSNDTGPMHIATAQNVKTIGLFGPNTPVIWGPYGKGNISIFKQSVSCSPCIRNDTGYMPDCKDAVCIKAISVNDVFLAAKKILAAK